MFSICFFSLLCLLSSDSPRADIGSLTSADDKILVQLGAAPAGLSQEEQDAYSKGLREIIRDIRARNIKDFNIVAAEITAYRARFLGDTTKILPL